MFDLDNHCDLKVSRSQSLASNKLNIVIEEYQEKVTIEEYQEKVRIISA